MWPTRRVQQRLSARRPLIWLTKAAFITSPRKVRSNIKRPAERQGGKYTQKAGGGHPSIEDSTARESAILAGNRPASSPSPPRRLQITRAQQQQTALVEINGGGGGGGSGEEEEKEEGDT